MKASRDIALDNIFLKPTSRFAHTEYSLEYHGQYLSERTGLAPQSPLLMRHAYDRFMYDFLFLVNDGIVDWAKTGRVTDMGHAFYAANGSDFTPPVKCPFQSPEQVWSFNAYTEYPLPDFDEQVKAYENIIQQAHRDFPNQLSTGGYYKTIVSGAIAAFGWEMLLLAAAEPVRLEKVLDSFFQRTLFHMKAWAQTSAEVIIQHDDFVWTSGPFMHPDLYRKIIIPRYAQLWKPLHDAGKKVLFCSDGNFIEFTPDLADAGADGFIFEPCNDFDFMAENFGHTKCLVGSFVDCYNLTFNNWDAAKKSIDKTFTRLAQCRGAIIAVGNHLPPNIPPDMLDRYFDYLLPRLTSARSNGIPNR